MRKPDQRRLTPDDWARAALDAIARGGVGAVAVETLAAELGATKGSFYWHFKNRDALIDAALERWEQRRTDAVIEHLEHEPDPTRRLRLLLEGGFELGPTDRAEIALLANPGHPAALRAVRRVTERRIGYLSDQLEALGWNARDARDRAVLIAYVYVGHIQLAHIAPKLTGADSQQRQIELAFNALVQGAAAVFR
ncbi:MAG: TetR/AcrR family transcriptional regulator [Actinomycetota bacterium]